MSPGCKTRCVARIPEFLFGYVQGFEGNGDSCVNLQMEKGDILMFTKI